MAVELFRGFGWIKFDVFRFRCRDITNVATKMRKQQNIKKSTKQLPGDTIYIVHGVEACEGLRFSNIQSFSLQVLIRNDLSPHHQSHQQDKRVTGTAIKQQSTTARQGKNRIKTGNENEERACREVFVLFGEWRIVIVQADRPKE